MKLLREDYPLADYMPVRDVVVEERVAKGKTRVLRKSEADAYHASKAAKERGHFSKQGEQKGHESSHDAKP